MSDSNEKSPTASHLKNYWPRFGMRLVLIVMAIVAICIGWMSNLNEEVRREKRFLEYLKEQKSVGYGCLYDYDFDADGNRTKNPLRPEPNWINWLFEDYPFPHVVELWISTTNDPDVLNGIKDLRKLKRLYLYEATSIESLGSLANLQLTELLLSDCPRLENTDAVKNFSKLESLVFESCPLISNIESVRGLPRLKRFRMNGCPLVKDLSPMANLSELEDVSLYGNFESIDAIQNCNELTRFLVDSEHIQNLEPIKNATKISYLWSRCANLESIDALAEMDQLETVIIKECKVPNVNALRSKHNLTDLSVLSKKLTDLSGLQDLPKLETLNISSCRVENFEDFTGLTALKELYARGCSRLTSLSGLDQSTALERIVLDQCDRLNDISAMSKLTQLKVIGFYHCDSLTEIDGLRGVTGLKRVNFNISKNVTGGDFFLELESPEFLNFNQTQIDQELVEKLKNKFPKADVRWSDAGQAEEMRRANAFESSQE